MLQLILNLFQLIQLTLSSHLFYSHSLLSYPLNDIFFTTPKIHIFVVILSTTQESTEPSKTSMMEFFWGK